MLAGTNDQWADPVIAHADDATNQADASFPLVWRTGRLLAILRHGRLAEHGTAAFVGVWHKDGVEVAFQPTGRLLLDGNELRWSTRDDKLLFTMPTGQEIEVAWRVQDGKLHLHSELWPAVP